MNVYLLRADSNRYRGLIMTVGDLYEFVHRFDGKPMRHPWSDAQVEWDPERLSFKKGDFPSLIPNVPVFTSRAATALEDLLVPNGELLPVTIGGEGYFLYNATRVVDALDELNSEIIRFPGKSKVLNIESHSFLEERVAGLAIFKIPQVVIMDVFVTDVFVERVRAAKLKGFDFPLVWSSS
jgi:hypothetical protein